MLGNTVLGWSQHPENTSRKLKLWGNSLDIFCMMSKVKEKHIMQLASFAGNWFLVLKWLACSHMFAVAETRLEPEGCGEPLWNFIHTELLCICLDAKYRKVERRVNVTGSGLRGHSRGLAYSLAFSLLFLHSWGQARYIELWGNINK